jgi:hypothetical protein
MGHRAHPQLFVSFFTLHCILLIVASLLALPAVNNSLRHADTSPTVTNDDCGTATTGVERQEWEMGLRALSAPSPNNW